MLLVQQPQHPSPVNIMPFAKQFSSPSHRRNPSAPAVVAPGQVQPTRTPGLLSLNKPAPPRQPRHPTPRQTKTKPQQQQQQSQASSPERHRGRNNSAKDKSARTVSKPRAGHGGRARQPSPSPITQSEQASTIETSPKPASSTPNAPNSQPSNSSATVLSSPSGRLAKRRNRASVPFPQSASTPSVLPKVSKRSQSPLQYSKPIPVPAKAKHEGLPMSQSDPVLSHFPRVGMRREAGNVFPICDDLDDVDDGGRPSTPSPTNRKGHAGLRQQTPLSGSDSDEGGPRTAPISMKEGVAKHYFPSPVPSPSRPNHKRTPSVPVDGVFELSFGSDNELSASDMSALFGRASSHLPRYDGSVRSTSTPLRKPDSTFKFASPMFQNSPSPEHLPAPMFSLAKMKKALESTN